MQEPRRAGSSAAGTGQAPAAPLASYPGAGLGLPRHGAGAVAGYGPRIAALFIDWLACSLIALFILRSQWWAYPIFAGEVYLLTALTGFTVGKRLLGLRVHRLDGRPVGFLWSFVRTILLLTVIPAVITDLDRRGLHDRAANTIVVRA